MTNVEPFQAHELRVWKVPEGTVPIELFKALQARLAEMDKRCACGHLNRSCDKPSAMSDDESSG